MGYFSSLLKQTGVGKGQRRAPQARSVAPIEVHETRLVVPAPTTAPAQYPAMAAVPPAVTGEATPSVPRFEAVPTGEVLRIPARPAVPDHYAVEFVAAEGPSVVPIKGIEVPHFAQVIAPEETVTRPSPPEELHQAARPRPPNPAAVTLEEVRQWVAAPLLRSVTSEEEQVVPLVTSPIATHARTPQLLRAGATEEHLPEPRTENVTLSIGSVQIIVDDPAPRPAAVPAQASAPSQAPATSSLDATRLARCYLTF